MCLKNIGSMLVARNIKLISRGGFPHMLQMWFTHRMKFVLGLADSKYKTSLLGCDTVTTQHRIPEHLYPQQHLS